MEGNQCQKYGGPGGYAMWRIPMSNIHVPIYNIGDDDV